MKSVDKSGDSLLRLAVRAMRWLWVMRCEQKPHFWAEAFFVGAKLCSVLSTETGRKVRVVWSAEPPMWRAVVLESPPDL